MKLSHVLIAVLAVALSAAAGTPSKPVTVPITLDHNRIVIDVYLQLPDGTSKRVRAWVNSGSFELMMSQRIASLFGPVKCDGEVCSGTPPSEMKIGDMKIALSGIRNAHVPSGFPKDVMVLGMSPEITIPSTILREHDVVFDYPNRELSIGEPGSVEFKGVSSKVQINSVGLIRIPSRIEDQSYSLALDTGASISLISGELPAKWHTAHASWPFVNGAVGAANMFGTPDESERFVVQIPTLQCGAATLSTVLVASLSTTAFQQFKDRVGSETIGTLGGDAFRNYRVGIDYSQSVVYFDRIANSPASDLSVVGLTLRPEADGRYTVTAVVDFDGKPSVPEVKPGDVLLGVEGAPVTGATLGQVWSLLGGSPGQAHSLTLEREGKRFTVEAPVHRFLAGQSRKDHATKPGKVRKESRGSEHLAVGT
jgi:PDZ domain